MNFLILSCGIFGVGHSGLSPQQQSSVACWVPPSCSGERGQPPATSPLPSKIRFSVQDTILEDLRRKWKVSAEEKPANEPPPTPFVIQQIGRGTTSEIEEITRMCIDVFFNKQDEDNVDGAENTKKTTAPWKALQLAYLRNFQQGDILARNAFKKDQLINLIVARRVYPLSDDTDVNANQANIVDDDSKIYNFESLSSTKIESKEKYVAGEIIGYSEVSEKIFGLGSNFDGNASTPARNKPRPYLSNLSVVADARRSGVGSELLAACEASVRAWDAGHAEMVLQVEEDNPTARRFYERRGWEVVFADPTGRRYDTSGFFLREARVTKLSMIKRLASGAEETHEDGGTRDPAASFTGKIRNFFFVQE